MSSRPPLSLARASKPTATATPATKIPEKIPECGSTVVYLVTAHHGGNVIDRCSTQSTDERFRDKDAAAIEWENIPP
jgi:hypothetical protein